MTKQPNIKKKRILLILGIVGVIVAAVAIFLFAVVFPQQEREKFEQILGFVPPWEELEFQALDALYYQGGKKYYHKDYVAKYAIKAEQLLYTQNLLMSLTKTSINGIESRIYSSGWIGREDGLDNYNFYKISPNIGKEQRYRNQYPIKWWDFNTDDVIQFHSGSNFISIEKDGSYSIFVFFVSGSEDTIYIYIYIVQD